jgi:hypothetical protein
MPSHTHSTQADPQAAKHATGMKVKTRLRAGGLSQNHNETLLRAPRPSRLQPKTRLKA